MGHSFCRRFIVLAAFFGTMSISGVAAGCDPDPWIVFPPISGNGLEITPLPPGHDFQIPMQSETSAFALLSAQSIVPLDRDTLNQLLPNTAFPETEGFQPYLVRAVALDEPLGSIHVGFLGRAILMQYNGPIVGARFIHRAFVLFLREPPTRLYVMVRLYD
jgi:hypothetical protein